MSGLLRASDEIDRLGHDLNSKIEVINGIKTLLNKFPDLMVYRPSDNKKYELVCCSSAVNHFADSYNYTEVANCSGPPIVYVWPYTLIDNNKVYSNPCYFGIGEVNINGFGINLDQNWEACLTENDIPNTLIRKIKSYFKSRPPINYNE